MNKLIFLTSITLIPSIVFSSGADLNQTKNQLKQLESKISQLKSKLNQSQNTRETLIDELKKNESDISKYIQQINVVEAKSTNKKKLINLLQQKQETLHTQLKNQQQLLNSHIRARYKMGEEQPLKWMLNQENPQAINHILTLYSYIFEARQNAIKDVKKTTKNLEDTELKLKAELTEQQQLQNHLQSKQQILNEDKNYHIELMKALDKSIQDKKDRLNDYQANRDNLSRLLAQLVVKAKSPVDYHFAKMKGKLPFPISAKGDSINKLNQGIEIHDTEGTPVYAVSAGKVVFSDWLKGYGLLLIISHNDGYMTLYGHNQSLFKNTGDTVNRGDQVATVGHSGGPKENGLYFEVRHGGKALPPLEWLS